MRRRLAFSRLLLRMQFDPPRLRDHAPTDARLATARDVEAHNFEGFGPHYNSLSLRPWLSIEPLAALAPGRWFRLRYRLSLYDRPVRPILSYRRGTEEIGWIFLPGPVIGRGEGIGRAPRDATAVWICPVASRGPFCFAIEAIELLSYAELVRLGLGGNRSRFMSALGTAAIGWRAESELNFRWAAQSSPITEWPVYQERLSIEPNPVGFERPRCDWGAAPVVRMLIHLDDGVASEQIDATLAALRAQTFPRWTLTLVGPGACAVDVSAKDPRAGRLEREVFGGGSDDLLGFLAPGDRLTPHSLACFIETMDRAPAALAAYCDEQVDATPILKPEWSPRLYAARPFVGRLMLTRLAHAKSRMSGDLQLIDELTFAAEVFRNLGRNDVLHIPRVLIEAGREPAPTSLAPPRPLKIDAVHVTIIMTTRDQPEFVRRSVTSLLERTTFAAFDLIIIDNGSTHPQALATLEAAARDPRVRRINAPGAFNFSRLCNLGAAEAQGEIIIFLNNDVEIIQPDWIDELASLALEENVGAVGCLLLYPNGRIQHAGIVMGMGEEAGHCDAGASPREAGWLARNAVVHEVSAVTGACLAVERQKFRAVGGFDADRLPIEFNDIDLCLRLDELGYQTLWTPFSRMVHYESASRGKATFRRLDKHAAERAYFRRRWADRLRDDPYYHPGLSLFSLSPALA